MAVSNLNVRVGFLFDERALKRIERDMRAAGRRLSDLGNQLTVSISLPLAAIGAAAIKSAGDIESLTLAMESQLGSAEAARKEIELLRKEALKPGLAFEQAVRGSVSLQAVGFSAEKAREVISRFGNALALAGKGGAELDGVVLALTQIKAKGIVSAEEINQIAERLPQIRTLMLQAFGTASTEAIQKLGITADQFIEGITEQMKTLPQAAGGIKNSLENFFDSLKNAAATLGLSLNKAFDITGKLDAFAAGISAVADGFAGLNPALQSTIGWLGAIFLAIGPLTSAFGILKTNAASIIGIWGGMVSSAKALQLWVLNVRNAFLALNLATQSLILVGVALAIATIVTQLGLLNGELNNSQKAMQAVAEAQAEIGSEAGKEVEALRRNISAIKDQNVSQETRKKAIDALTSSYPDYLQGMNLEKADLTELEALQNRVTASIIKRIAETKKATALEKIQSQIIDERLKQDRLRTEGATFLEKTPIGSRRSFTESDLINSSIRKEQELNDLLQKTEAQFDRTFGIGTQELVLQMPKPLGKAAEATKGLTDATTDLTNSKKGEAAAHKENTNALDAYLDNLNKIKQAQDKVRQAAEAMGIGRLETLPQAGAGGVTSQAAPVTPQIASVGTSLVTALTPAQALFQALNTQVFTFNEAFSLMAENVAENGSLIQQSLFGIAESATAFAEAGGASIGGFVNALVAGAKKAVGAYIRIGVASIVAKALTSAALNPFAALALGGVAGAAAQALFNKMLSGIKIPEFARGTKFAPGGLALVGEQGAELVNLPRGSQVTPNAMTNRILSDNAASFSLTHRISGSDLLFILERAQAQSKRIRGF